MKNVFALSLVFINTVLVLQAQSPVISNNRFSIGSYGRAGIARGDNVEYPRSLNLNGMGSIGGRMEESDYFELAMPLHFTPVSSSSDSTKIKVQARLAMYTTQGQIIGNVTSNKFAAENLYSPYLAQNGSKPWGHYFWRENRMVV